MGRVGASTLDSALLLTWWPEQALAHAGFSFVTWQVRLDLGSPRFLSTQCPWDPAGPSMITKSHRGL